MTDNQTTEPLHSIIAAMWVEYDKDENCDYYRVNRLIEDAAEIVATTIGGYDKLDEIGRARVDD